MDTKHWCKFFLLVALNSLSVWPGTDVMQANADTINLVKEQVCYLPDIDLIEEQDANSSDYPAGLYLTTSSPSRCVGFVTFIEMCGVMRNTTDAARHRIIFKLYRQTNNNTEYQEIANLMKTARPVGDFVCSSEVFILGDSYQWIVKEGDILGIDILSSCEQTDRCPVYPVLNPTVTIPNKTLLYVSTPENFDFSSVQTNQLNPEYGFMNARARVVSTPPSLPDHCTEQPTPLCATTHRRDQSILQLGVVDESPGPERRFWGGGTYILPYRVPSDGTARVIRYTALLNTQGGRTNISNFRFVFGWIREELTSYQLMASTMVTISSTAPLSGEFNDTIHSGRHLLPDWTVKTSDLFAVFIYNECSDSDDYCPAQVNLLNNTECQSTIFQPFISRDPPVLATSIDKSAATFLSEANMDINIQVMMTPEDSSISSTLPHCREETTSPPQSTEQNSSVDPLGTAAGVLILSILLVLIVLVIVIFVILRRQNRTKKVEMNRIYEEVAAIALSPTIQIEVNERGWIRRTTMDSNSQHSTRRQRAYSRIYDYSRIDVQRKEAVNPMAERTPPPTPGSTLNQYARLHVNNEGIATPTYERQGGYSTPIDSITWPAGKQEVLKGQLASLGIDEIPEHQLQLQDELGRGQFGTVYKAKWEFSVSEDNAENPDVRVISALVAVKVMDDDKTDEDRIQFLQEAVLMGQFNDPNIVAVFGVVTKSDKLMMLCELMDEDLRDHLTNIRTRFQSSDQSTDNSEEAELPAILLSYCRKIASSFVYLGLKGFIHRDLAARNILISKEGDCKISDFGMSRDLQDDSYYKSHGGLIPVKWTAPEAIMYRKYSTKSDVWSYGILLYEIWSLGYKPYYDNTNQEVIRKVEKGYRLPPPPGCPRTIYDLMIKCTHPQPESRPTFTAILTSLQRPDYQLLKWTPEDVAASSEGARKLGSPLEEGEELYTELQNTYLEGTAESRV